MQGVATDEGAGVGFPEADAAEGVTGGVHDLEVDAAGGDGVALGEGRSTR
jgi:hypothetical protein